ncbi:uncharacterized protein LOC131228736 [Magnolia sinica]|uniref:uncharacterized protein LOC131228736 n=1 Tax=Magnolia sinica TaxID=86752 RepID=UPI00265A9EB0|nr:uncharacterized protein LOC131228736 [Magnolia sinica]
MDSEANTKLTELADKGSQIFLDFMTRITKFEELVALGSRLLVGFHQELECFRRPPLHETSKVAGSIIEANHTERLKAYVEAGCRHVPVAIQNTIKLQAFQHGLQDHITKAKVVLDELERLTEDVIGIMEAANGNILDIVGNLSGDRLVHHTTCFEKGETETGCRRGLRISEYAITMRIIYNMMKRDCEMQEKIVTSLDYSSSSEHLENYCLMWDLRPFIDDDIMHQAWGYIP